MKAAWSLGPFTIALLLGACTQLQGRQLVDNAGADSAGAHGPAGSADMGYPARLTLDGAALPVEAAPLQPEGGEWRSTGTPGSGAEIAFGVPGQPALLAITCQHDAHGYASVHFSRMTRAETGAKALFALIGNGRIARLSLDATRAGETGEWQGRLPASDPRLDVLRGGNSIEATLPGGGTLKLPASSEPTRFLQACRAGDQTPDTIAAAL